MNFYNKKHLHKKTKPEMALPIKQGISSGDRQLLLIVPSPQQAAIVHKTSNLHLKLSQTILIR